MSHYKVGVLVPASLSFEEAKIKIDELLAPFDENIEVPEYKKRYGERDLDFERSRFEARDDHADFDSFLADCDIEKDDEGYYRWSQYNPKSQYDYYTIGGRYHMTEQPLEELRELSYLLDFGYYGDDPQGRFKDIPKEEADKQAAEQINILGAKITEMGIEHVDAIPTEFILKEHEAFIANKGEKGMYGGFWSLVTPDGEWHEQGKVGWFGTSDDDKEFQAEDVGEEPQAPGFDSVPDYLAAHRIWENKRTMPWYVFCAETFKKYPDHKVYVLDCHI